MSKPSSPEPQEKIAWVGDDNVALLTDLYQLTMLQAYFNEGMNDEAVFSLFVRRLHPRRNFLVACGIDEVLRQLEHFHFSEDALAYLASLGMFSARFLEHLRGFRFTGDVYAVPEGTPMFEQEPMLEVVAPLPQAQLLETFVMNQVHLQTLAASKAARVVAAARGREVIDFGLRRMHGADAGIKIVRAAYIAGAHATSNVLAGKLYGIPVAGTMAHSYIQAHPDQLAAFRAFTRSFPRTTLLVDTYDTLEGVRDVVKLARELGDAFQVRAIRLDSGDLLELSRQARQLLDEAGLQRVEIVASGNLDEEAIERLLQRGALINAFGVGTAMGTSDDVPHLDIVYKLVSYAGRGRVKLSPGKMVLPGRKQVFRQERDGRAEHDILGTREDTCPGRPLLTQVMRAGKRLSSAPVDLAQVRERCLTEVASLPDAVRSLGTAQPRYPVELSAKLEADYDHVASEMAALAHTRL